MLWMVRKYTKPHSPLIIGKLESYPKIFTITVSSVMKILICCTGRKFLVETSDNTSGLFELWRLCIALEMLFLLTIWTESAYL